MSSPPVGAGPAVAYFAKAPLPGQVKTRLCPPLTTDEAAALYGTFLRKVVQPVPGARTLVYGWPGDELETLGAALPVGFEDSGIELRPQRGDDLWERMQDCFEELFTAGHSPVLIRNTDSPDLDPSLVSRALAECHPGQVVLGPDLGGGYYLIALAEPHPELLGTAAEGANTVFDQTVDQILALGLELIRFTEQPDVDTFEDLIAMWEAR